MVKIDLLKLRVKKYSEIYNSSIIIASAFQITEDWNYLWFNRNPGLIEVWPKERQNQKLLLHIYPKHTII